MKSIEELILYGIKYILNKKINPNMSINCVTDLTTKEIDILIDFYGIKGVILDVDETLRFNMKMVSSENDEWLDMLVRKLKVIVVSNGIDKKIEEYLRRKNIEYICFAHKPLKKNFIKACNKLMLSPEQIAVIGDDIFSDIYGGNRNNMFTIKVNGEKKLIKR